MKPLTSFIPVVAALAIAAPAFAQPIGAISLPSGRSTTIDAPGLTRVAVGDGRIAGVVPVGTQQVIINAKAPGHTTVLVWTNSGRREYDVTVSEQTMDDLATMLRGSINEPGVMVEPIGRALVVRGDVADQRRPTGSPTCSRASRCTRRIRSTTSSTPSRWRTRSARCRTSWRATPTPATCASTTTTKET